MDTDLNRQLVLSPQYANEIRNDPHLNFSELIHRVGDTSNWLHSGLAWLTCKQDLLGHLPGFEVFKRENSETSEVVRTKLTPSLGMLLLEYLVFLYTDNSS